MKVIILAGGGGTRLYPLSTPERPKQFLALADGKPLIVNTIDRFLKICVKKDIVVVTGEKYRALTQECLEQHDCRDVSVVYEPCARNTAPAIALAVRYCKDVLKCNDDEAIFVVPSDHVIYPTQEYVKLVEKVVLNSKKGGITVLGVVPTCPEVGYGYIKAENSAADIKTVLQFKEKPDFGTAKKYLEEGNYFWNAGMFGFSIQSFEHELAMNAGCLFELYKTGYSGFFHSFENAEKISIDYAIAEKSDKIDVIPMNIKWSDIGGFRAYYDFCQKDLDGNVLIGNITAQNCKNCFIYSDGSNLKVVGQENKIVASANGFMIVSNL